MHCKSEWSVYTNDIESITFEEVQTVNTNMCFYFTLNLFRYVVMLIIVEDS